MDFSRFKPTRVRCSRCGIYVFIWRVHPITKLIVCDDCCPAH